MPRKRPRQNIPPLIVEDEESDVSPFGKKAYVFIFTLTLLYSVLSIFLGSDGSETEIIESVSSRHYSSRSRSGMGSSSLDITLNTNLGNEYFISTSGGQPFKEHDTILTFSNKLFKKVGLQAGQYYYEFGRQLILLILIGVVSIAGGLYTLFGETIFRSVLYIICGVTGILLLVYLTN
jgi:hypothetical protein